MPLASQNSFWDPRKPGRKHQAAKSMMQNAPRRKGSSLVSSAGPPLHMHQFVHQITTMRYSYLILGSTFNGQVSVHFIRFCLMCTSLFSILFLRWHWWTIYSSSTSTLEIILGIVADYKGLHSHDLRLSQTCHPVWTCQDLSRPIFSCPFGRFLFPYGLFHSCLLNNIPFN